MKAMILVVFVAVFVSGCSSFTKHNRQKYAVTVPMKEVVDQDGNTRYVPGEPQKTLIDSDKSWKLNIVSPDFGGLLNQTVAPGYGGGYAVVQGGYYPGYSHVSGVGSYGYAGDYYPAPHFGVPGGTYSPTPMMGSYGSYGGHQGGRNQY